MKMKESVKFIINTSTLCKLIGKPVPVGPTSDNAQAPAVGPAGRRPRRMRVQRRDEPEDNFGINL